MQKKFFRYFLIIMVLTVAVTLCGNTLIQIVFAQDWARERGKNLIASISDRINNNNAVIATLKANLDENYLARARALANIIAATPDIVLKSEDMQNLADMLRVDEVHVIDENGILQWGNVPAYYGMDFDSTMQTRAFLPALKDTRFELAQIPQPNGIEGKLFQYIGVARLDKSGIVQVGVRPEVLANALIHNEITSILRDFNVTRGENVLAIDRHSGIIVASTDKTLIGVTYHDAGIPEACFLRTRNHAWFKYNQHLLYAIFGEYEDYILAATFTQRTMYAAQIEQNIVAGISSLLLGISIIVAIFLLLKRVIIHDIDTVNRDVHRITHGDLDVVVNAKATPEFAILSQGINDMVHSLKQQMVEIEHQGAKLTESHRNIMSSLRYARRIQSNLLPDFSLFATAFSDASVLWEPRDMVGGDIYWIKKYDSVTVLCVCDCTGHGTPGALLTMLVATALESIVTLQNCQDPSSILWELDQKLIATLSTTDSAADIRDGADVAILCIAADGAITLSSANISVFICDGSTTDMIKGQKLSLGGGMIQSKDCIQSVCIPGCKENAYYVATDGLFDQIGDTNNIPFGYKLFRQIILEDYPQKQSTIVQNIWKAFLAHMGHEVRRDDITLISFKL